MMANKELLPCPFCGGEAELVSTFFGRFIRCKMCRSMVKANDTNEEAINAWNTRTHTIPVGNGEDYEVTQK